ncbi:unnamed protein product [Trifolium pratense]|uniref:Uncharacterized protein n=2 Tax=Trifolium pratense TaxID=57577 RepID=A0ACB0MBL9_TRIPR|nr:unnamed protein product [Trifolium pratense]
MRPAGDCKFAMGVRSWLIIWCGAVEFFGHIASTVAFQVIILKQWLLEYLPICSLDSSGDHIHVIVIARKSYIHQSCKVVADTWS